MSRVPAYRRDPALSITTGRRSGPAAAARRASRLDRGRARRGRSVLENPLTGEIGLAVGDPWRRRIALQEIAEPLELPVEVVGLALRTRDVVVLALVHQIDHL